MISCYALVEKNERTYLFSLLFFNSFDECPGFGVLFLCLRAAGERQQRNRPKGESLEGPNNTQVSLLSNDSYFRVSDLKSLKNMLNKPPSSLPLASSSCGLTAFHPLHP